MLTKHIVKWCQKDRMYAFCQNIQKKCKEFGWNVSIHQSTKILYTSVLTFIKTRRWYPSKLNDSHNTVCMGVYVCVWLYLCLGVCVCACVCVYVCMCVRVSVWNSKTSLKQLRWSKQVTVYLEARSRFDFAKIRELKFISIWATLTLNHKYSKNCFKE